MDPSSPAKRRALAPLDANVNAISSPTKLHKHSKLGAAPQSPRKSNSSGSPVKSLNLKRSFAAAAVDIFDENALVPKKKQCQEPASALAAASNATTTTTTTAAPVAVAAPAREVALAPEATSPVPAIPSASAAASTPAPAPAQTEMEMDVDPDATETQSEQSEEQNQQSEQQLEPEVVQGENELLPEQQQKGSRHETPRTRSASPADTSAVFDTSAMDMSQNTTILTEPDAEQARTLPPPRPRRLLTREEARQKARILRLKLGLANYKLQTGQENVPLDKLEVKPRPGQQPQETKMQTQTQTQTAERALPRVMVQPPSSRDGPPEKDAEEEVVEETETDEPAHSQESAEAEVATTQAPQVQEEKESRNVVSVLPRLDMDNLKAGNDEDEPTSAVSGGIVSSLLSLARGSSSSVSTSS
ncbi:hypothetical protein CTAM01_09210 [Colletotrichum tamarilloi]|uniref:Cyclin-dependent kinase protein n=1 Tax=Colletotrichum tamarilloi TaxID=1209934 RepID=A0ABQ9R453_9PEZI|nr:uncharacterized protein CTAM01_09210 [Colletotrichum tamarilloi]KAK1494019.1 hypothetical protein CTAM01_09210 [Colletotrichum tamarilloi]